MKTEVRRIGTVDMFCPVGPLSDVDGETFCQALLGRVTAEAGNARVGVGMQDVPYLDSAALEGLLAVSEALGAYGPGLKLAGVTATCREIFELTGLASRFRFFGSVEDVVKSFLT